MLQNRASAAGSASFVRTNRSSSCFSPEGPASKKPSIQSNRRPKFDDRDAYDWLSDQEEWSEQLAPSARFVTYCSKARRGSPRTPSTV